MTQYHKLKANGTFFPAVASGKKKFLIIENTMGIYVNNKILLEAWNPKKECYTGQTIEVLVTSMLKGKHVGIMEGFIVMSIQPLKINI